MSKNNILKLKGEFHQKKNQGKPGRPKISTNKEIDSYKLIQLLDDLKKMKEFWESEQYIDGALISIYYDTIVAKSNRVSSYFASSKESANSSIVGSKFNASGDKHIVTHYVSISTVEKAIEELGEVISIVLNEFSGFVNSEIFNDNSHISNIPFHKYEISKSKFLQYVVDSTYIEKFDINEGEVDVNSGSVVTVYHTNKNLVDILKNIGINKVSTSMIGEETVLLSEDELKILKNKMPYYIAMSTVDLSKLDVEDSDVNDNKINTPSFFIPQPTNEPIVGVIDTLFYTDVYFSEWVESTDFVSDDISKNFKDYNHGTAVCSLIVDGPSLNPELDDECGRFKVRHFGVALASGFNSFDITKNIEDIVIKNSDIKVWNLSLGSIKSVNDNFISIEASVLDELQYKYDVLFVVSGTNRTKSSEKKIGSPADSINSVVVNSVKKDGTPCSYTREGIVLSFFTKPDVSYYGGDTNELINVCNSVGKMKVSGTSYAAPWVTRKLAYLIGVLGFSREAAKAIIIDSAIGWEKVNDYEKLSKLGHGIVPIKISDIVKSASDEIKFFVTGKSELYDTYNYNFPVPINGDKFPFYAKATLAYFPSCSRNQGVDYTNTEFDIYFGRINDDGEIKSINENKQSLDSIESYIQEKNARKKFRKWDNVKFIGELIKPGKRPRKVYSGSKMWGMSIKTKERLDLKHGNGVKFGVVVTLKEMFGVNRIETFKQNCSARGWLVEEVNIDNMIDIYNVANEEIVFD